MLSDTLVYLVVFWDGICTVSQVTIISRIRLHCHLFQFHFTDMSGIYFSQAHISLAIFTSNQRTCRTREKSSLSSRSHVQDIVGYATPSPYIYRSQRMFPDWIAHGILDSIVDSFFPYLEDVEKEVMRMEDLVFAENGQIDPGNAKSDDACLSPQPVPNDAEKVVCVTPSEKGDHPQRPPPKTFSIFRLFPGPQKLRKSRGFIYSVLESMSLTRESKSISTTATLRGLAKIRRLVTSMTRLLATKSEVIAQIRKRLLTQNSGLVNGQSRVEDIDVAIYMGDVQGMHYRLPRIVFLIAHTHTRSHSINTAFVKPLRANA